MDGLDEPDEEINSNIFLGLKLFLYYYWNNIIYLKNKFYNFII